MHIIESLIKKIENIGEKYGKIFCISSVLGFIILSAIGIYFHEIWYDESQAWLIARELNFYELLDYLKYEGHLFLWYTILMPFAKLHFPFPYTLQIINWIFAIGAILVLWKKAPFNPITKTLITFSAPIAYQHSVLARCYAIGILLLSLLLVFYKDKLKHPYLYAILIFLCANTNIICMFGASAFGLFFFIDYIKANKEYYKKLEFYNILAIALICIYLIFKSLLGGNEYSFFLYRTPEVIIWKVIWAVCPWADNFWRASIYLPLWIFLSLQAFYKDKRVFCFIVYIQTIMYIMFYSLYCGGEWHHYFFLIYMFFALWLYKINNNEKDLKYKLLCALLIFTLISQVFYTQNLYTAEIKMPYQDTKNFAKKIASDDDVKNGVVYACVTFSHALIPYLENYGINPINCYTNKKATFHDYRYYFEYCYSGRNISNINKNLSKYKELYLITDSFQDDYFKLLYRYWDTEIIYASENSIHHNTVFYLYKLTAKSNNRKTNKLVSKKKRYKRTRYDRVN